MASLDSRVLPNLRTREAIQGYLRGLAQQLGVKEADEWLARELDSRDQLSHLRGSFNMPTIGDMLDEEERESGEEKQPVEQAGVDWPPSSPAVGPTLYMYLVGAPFCNSRALSCMYTGHSVSSTHLPLLQ